MVLRALVSLVAFVVAKRWRGRTRVLVGIGRAYRGRASGVMVESPDCEPQAPPPPVAKHRAVEGPAAVVCLYAFGVVASAKREVGAPRSEGVVVIVHTATGGVAAISLS